jgi:Glycosyl transferase family 2
MSQRPAAASVPAYTPLPRPNSQVEAIGIVIPAHNQAETIAQCIFSLFAANSHSGWHNSLWIVVVADACTDDTAKVAREALGTFGQVLEVSARSLQTAHRIGASAVMDHFADTPRHALLLTSTNAAANLPRDWIDTQLKCSMSPIGLGSSR